MVEYTTPFLYANSHGYSYSNHWDIRVTVKSSYCIKKTTKHSCIFWSYQVKKKHCNLSSDFFSFIVFLSFRHDLNPNQGFCEIIFQT